MNRSYSLRGRDAFARLYERGATWSRTDIRVRYLVAADGGPRFAFSAPRSAGNAVARNRARRVVREAVRHSLPTWPAGMYHFRLLSANGFRSLSDAEKVVHDFRYMLRA